MQDFPVNKTEYHYYAILLIFGKRSPKVHQVSAYSLESLRSKKDLVYREESGLDIDGKQEIIRHLRLGEHRSIQTSHTDLRSDISRAITLIDTQHKVHITDSIFSDDEFRYFKEDWNRQIESKIRNIGILLYSMHHGTIDQLPLLVNECPNIAKTVLEHRELWHKKDKDGKSTSGSQDDLHGI